MAKLHCRCGHWLSSSMDNSNATLTVFTQPNLETEHAVNMWWCSVCERIYLFRDGSLARCWALEPEADSYPPVDEDTITEELETRYFDYDRPGRVESGLRSTKLPFPKA